MNEAEFGSPVNGVEILSAAWKLMTKAESEPTVGWKAELRNTGPKASSVTLKIQLLDADGFEVESDLQSLHIQGRTTKSVTGRTAELETAVTQVRIEILSSFD